MCDYIWYFLFFFRAFDVELLYIAQRLKIPIAEVAVNWTEIEGREIVHVLTRSLTCRSRITDPRLLPYLPSFDSIQLSFHKNFEFHVLACLLPWVGTERLGEGVAQERNSALLLETKVGNCTARTKHYFGMSSCCNVLINQCNCKALCRESNHHRLLIQFHFTMSCLPKLRLPLQDHPFLR